jgi:hypothetical protein
MSFAVHPEQEDFRNEFAKGCCGARKTRFWGPPRRRIEIANRKLSRRELSKQTTNKAALADLISFISSVLLKCSGQPRAQRAQSSER